MANLVRRGEPGAQTPSMWEPQRLVRELLGWDPFAEMLPSLATREQQAFVPTFEVKETKDAYVFTADLPGVKEEDLELTLTGNRLTVSGKREAEAREETDRFFAYERSYGAFSRSFTLPEGIDAEHVDADFKSGVLKIRVPKAPEHQPKKISLKGIGEKLKGALGGKDVKA